MKKKKVTVLKRRSECTRVSFFNRNGSLLLALLLLMFASSAVTYAWISRNDTVKNSGIYMQYAFDELSVGGVQIHNGVITIIDPDELETGSPLDDYLIPGSVLTMKIGIANESETNAQTITSVGFQTPKIWPGDDGIPYANLTDELCKGYDEIPTLVDGSYYYLGTQLKVDITSYTIYEYEFQTTTVNGEQKEKMVIIEDKGSANLTMDPVPMTNTSGEAQNNTLLSGLSIPLPAMHLIAFDVVVTFEDTGEEQNVYQNFGDENGKAKFTRTLAINVNEQ